MSILSSGDKGLSAIRQLFGRVKNLPGEVVAVVGSAHALAENVPVLFEDGEQAVKVIQKLQADLKDAKADADRLKTDLENLKG